MKKLIFSILLLLSLQSFAQVTGYSAVTFRARDSSLTYQLQNYSSSIPNQGLPDWYKQYIAPKSSNYVMSWNPSNNQYGYTGKVDTIYREAGKDSIIFTIAGVRYAIKDSTGGGSSGLTVGTTTLTSGTDTRVLFDDAGVLGEDAGMVFNKTTNNLTVGSATVSSLTATRVTLAGTSGILEDDADLTFSGTTLDIGSGNAGTLNLGNSNINSPDANGMYIFAGGGSLFFGTSTSTYGMAIKSGSVYIGGSTTPTARLHLPAGTTAASAAPLKFTTGTSQTTAEAGAMEYTTPQLFFTNGRAVRQEIPQIQQSRVSTQYDNTTTTLGNVTGLTANVAASGTYRFEARLYTTSDVGGGVKVAIAGTATATAIIYEGLTTNAGLITQSRATALATAVGAVTAVTAAYVVITGTITVNAAGTLTVQAAANAATGTTSVLVGSTFVLTEMN